MTKKSGRVGRDAQDGGGGLVDVGCVLPRRLDDPGAEEGVAHADGVGEPGRPGEVVDPVERHRRLHGGVGVLEARLELRVAGGQRRQRGEVAPGGPAGDHEVVGVTAVVGDVVPDPGDGALDVDDVRGPRVAGGEAVVDRHADPPLGGHPVHQGPALVLLGAEGPGPAVHLQEHGRVLDRVVAGRQVDVEVTAASGLGVGQVADHPDRVVPEVEGPGEAAPRRRQVGRVGGRVELLHVVDAEPLHEGVVEDVGGRGGSAAPCGPGRARWPRRGRVPPWRAGRRGGPSSGGWRRRARSGRASAARSRRRASRRRRTAHRRAGRVVGARRWR